MIANDTHKSRNKYCSSVYFANRECREKTIEWKIFEKTEPLNWVDRLGSANYHFKINTF